MEPLHRIRKLFLIAVASFFIFAFFYSGKFLSSPASSPQKSDLIIVLGGDAGARSLKGVELYNSGYAQKVLLTGLEDGEQETRPYYLNWRAQIFISKGIPKKNILFDIQSMNSWDEANNTLKLMKSYGWKSVIVVSDPPHLRRLHWVWGKVFKDSGLRYTLIAGVPQWWQADKWWSNEQAGKFVINEYVKLIYYFFSH